MKRILIITFFFLPIISVFAQDIKKDVTVVKPYEPTVQDVSKISLLPAFNDTSNINPGFEYKISPVRMDLPFQPRPVPAAKMVPDPLKKIYNNYIKLGFGNPLSPLVEFSATNGRSKENTFGVFLRHHSANGNVKINNGTKVEAPFSDNEIDVYGKHIFDKAVLSGNVFYTANKTTFYGIETPLDPALVYDKKDYNQNYQKAGLNVNLASNYNDSNKLTYQVGSGFSYLNDEFKNVENHLNINGQASQNYMDFYVGASTDLNYYRPGSGNDSIFNTIFCVRPFLSKKSELWRLEVALRITFDADKEKTHIYNHPFAMLEFNVAPSVLKAFVAYGGFLETNNLDKIRLENPYILPGLQVKNTDYKTHVFGGMKGSFSSSMNFMTTVAYSSIDNQYFYINDTLREAINQANPNEPISPFHNYFQTVYDNIKKLQVTAELDYSASEKVTITARGNYYNYTTYKVEKPWHLPNLDLSLGLKYNLRDKIILTSEAFFVGERFAKKGDKAISLDPFVDINLGAEYRYTKLLSAFVQIRNLTASTYQTWYQYPAYRFQIMGGITYLF